MEAKIRGAVIQARKDFVEEHFGEASWEPVFSSLSEEDQEIIGGLIVSAGWYPFEVGERLDKAIVDILGHGDLVIFEDIGAQSAKRNLSTIHKPFLTPGNPQAFMTQADAIYKFYYNVGRREWKPTGPNSGVMTTYDAETFSVPDCLTVIGWYKEALRMCGAKSVEIVEETCRARGGDCCRYRISWKM